MPPDPVHAVTLACHPETPAPAVRGLAARIGANPGGGLAVRYVIEGDHRRLRVPALRAPRAADGLWRHTCCELFVGSAGCAAYYEFNFSPSGEWAAYAFDGYRVLRADESFPAGLDPRVALRAYAERLELEAMVRLDGLRLPAARFPLRLALAAVVEDSDGGLSYWALRHPPGKPDFHHPESFTLQLAGGCG